VSCRLHTIYAFHEEERIAQAQAELPVSQVSDIPSESEPLRALARVHQELAQEIGRRCLQACRSFTCVRLPEM